MSGPDFDELVGELPPEERARVRRAHDALVAAGPPADVPAALAELWPVARFPRRRALALGLAAALAGAAAFGGGYLVGTGGPNLEPEFTLGMRGTAAAPAAVADLVVFKQDEAGNWPMEMTVRGLSDGRYELLLTRDGKPAASCGTFFVQGETVAYLNAPYKLRAFDGWVVTRVGSQRILLRTESV